VVISSLLRRRSLACENEVYPVKLKLAWVEHKPNDVHMCHIYQDREAYSNKLYFIRRDGRPEGIHHTELLMYECIDAIDMFMLFLMLHCSFI
jgi:hypothetical protein